MPANKFRFISPGIQFHEVDESTIPSQIAPVGPVVVGRSMKGPGLVPTRVRDYDEFVKVFGDPSPGVVAGDVWRKGNGGLAPTYGAYAARAYLENSDGLTFIRLLGRKNKYCTTTAGPDDVGNAGWQIGSGFSSNASAKGGAYGLFLVASGSSSNHSGTADDVTGTLAAVWYMKDVDAGSYLRAYGTTVDSHNATNATTGANAAKLLNAASSSYTIEYVKGGTPQKRYSFDFDENGGNFIRRMFNTNPTKLDSNYY